MDPIHKAPCWRGTSGEAGTEDVSAVPLAVCVNVRYRWDLLSLGKSWTRNLGFVVAGDYVRRIWPCWCRSTGELHAVAVPFDSCLCKF